MNQEEEEFIWVKVADEILDKEPKSRLFTWEELETVSVFAPWRPELFAFGWDGELWRVVEQNDKGILAKAEAK